MLKSFGEIALLFKNIVRNLLLQVTLAVFLFASCVSAAQATITINFPDRSSLGKIYLLRPDYGCGIARDYVTGRACEARGRVTINRGQTLSFVGAYALTENMPALSKIPADGLVHLDLRKLEIESKDLASIAHLQSLRRLELDSTDIDDQGLHFLAGLTNLQSLFLSKTLVRGMTLSELGHLPRLTCLDLSRTRLAPGVLSQLEKCKELWDLRLDECGVRDVDVAYLARCKKLSCLSLRDSPYFSARGLAALGTCEKLKKLNYMGNRMSDEKIAAMTGLSLDTLILRQNDMNAEQATALRKAMPHTHVEIQAESHLPMEVFAPLH